jgi:hypothetical protein
VAARISAALGAAFAALAVVWLATAHRDDTSSRPAFAMAYIALCGLFLILGAGVRAQPWRAMSLAFATSGLLVLGVLAIFTIGDLLLLAAVAAGIALGRSWNAPAPTALAALAAVALLAGGFYATDVPSTCPGPNTSGGGTTMFHGSYTYVCENGVMRLHAGS